MGIIGKMGFMGIIGIIGIIGIGGDAWENRHRHTEIRTSVDVQPQSCERSTTEPVNVQPENLWTFNQRTYGRSTREPVNVQSGNL